MKRDTERPPLAWLARRRRPGALALGVCGPLAVALAVHAGPPYLTGVVDDGESQVIEMPRLPGAWQRRIAWLAPEGATVTAGEVVVRLDPGDLIATTETAEMDLERRRLEAGRAEAETALAVLDAEKAVAEAESEVRLARIDAEVPASATRQLDHDNAQLRLAVAEHARERAAAALADQRAARSGALALAEMRIATAEAHHERMRRAIERAEIQADRRGVFVHSENEFTGNKVFAGETLQPTAQIAKVTSGGALRFRFWAHEADIRALPRDTELLVAPDALPATRLRARVRWTSKQAATRAEWSGGGYFEVLAEPLADVPPTLTPGMTVFAEVGP